MVTIPVLFLTYNRIGYSQKSLEALLKTSWPIEIWHWDNGSTDGTVEWLKALPAWLAEKGFNPTDPRISVNLCPENRGINHPFNNFMRAHKNDPFVAKVDNDTIVSPDWLSRLMEPMERVTALDAVGAFMQRPPGVTFKDWVASDFMRKVAFDSVGGQEVLAYCSYTGGTGVLLRTRMFHEEGLLWEDYPCNLGDLTTFFRLLFTKKGGNNIAWYSGTTVKLLNIKEDGVSLTGDYAAYDDELKKVRDDGNDWYVKTGGPAGIAKLIEQDGGRDRL